MDSEVRWFAAEVQEGEAGGTQKLLKYFQSEMLVEPFVLT